MTVNKLKYISTKSSYDQKKIIEIESLELANDYWLYISVEKIKKIRGLWLIEMIGPGINVGRWRKCLKTEYAHGGQHWEWIPHSLQHEVLIGEKGQWIFRGRCPVIQMGRWMFVDEEPLLFFVTSEGSEKRKVFLENGSLFMAKDSRLGLKKREALIRTLELEVRYSQEVKKYNDYYVKTAKALFQELGVCVQKKQNELVYHDNSSDKRSNLDSNKESSSDEQQVFNLLVDEKEKEQIVQELSLEQIPITIWTPKQKIVLDGYMEIMDLSAGLVNLRWIATKKGKLLSIQLANYEHEVLFVKGNTTKGIIFFSVKKPRMLEGEDLGISLELDLDIWKVQRRGAFRLTYPESAKRIVKVNWGREEVRDARIVNISATGMCLSISNSFVEIARVGSIIKELVFSLDDEILIKCSACIRWKKELGAIDSKEDEEIILGVQFIYLAQKSSQRINRYVLEQSYNTISKN